MSAKYDLEMLTDDVKAILTNYLNTKITAINTEKNDTITLASVDSGAYFLQQLNGQTANYDPFILYGVTNIEGEGIGPGTSQEVQLDVVLVLADNGQDVEISKRMFRYGRALKEVYEEHFSENENGLKIVITSLVPVQFTSQNNANDVRAVGVRLNVVLA